MSASTSARTRRQPLTLFVAQEALEKLRWDILDGVFEPDTKLPFAMLQKRYAVGVGTIREALSHLVSEGLILLDAGRGFRVAPVSRDDLIDISELRVDFERRALRDAIANGGERWEVGIISTFHLLDRVETLPLAERMSAGIRWTQLHHDYHAALVAACRSRWLLNFRGLLFAQAERYRLLSQRHRPKAGGRKDEHRAIMQAVLKRDADTACDLAEQHIRRTVDEVLRHVPQIRE